MKKIKKLLTIGLAVLLMFCTGVSLSACDSPTDTSNTYKVTAELDDWLHGSLKKYYKPGDTVVVKINIAHDVGFSLYMNGEALQQDLWESEREYWQYSFTMPEEDVRLTYKVSDGMQMLPIIEQIAYNDSVVYRFDSALSPQYGVLYINGIKTKEYSLAFEEMRFVEVTDIPEVEDSLISYTMDIVCISAGVTLELASLKTFWIQGIGKMFEIINEVDFSAIYEDYASQEYDRTLLIQAYEEKYPNAGKATILRYCGTYESGAIVAMLAGSDESFDCALWTETVADYDFNYSDGNRIRVLYDNEFYTLTEAYKNGYLTKENIAGIHIKWDGKLPNIEPEAPIEKSYFEIIDELQMSDIVKIETVEYAGSVAPYIREPIEYKTSTLATDIETVYTWLKSLQGTLTQIADEEAQLAGAGTTIFTIYTSQNYFTISDVGRNYLNIEGGFYEQKGETPDIIGETVTYRFESYYDEASLLINDKKAKDYTFDFDKLVCIEKNFETSGNPYKLVASIGVLQLYDEKHFIRNDIQYEIVGKFDFSQIFKDYPTNDSNDSNDIFYAAAYPQDFEYNGRHYRLVQGVGLKTTVTQEELGELLGYIIREEDVSAFTQEYPKVDYVIDNGIYDYDTSNRVAFYSVKAYPDLSLICMNQLGEYVLFQDITDLLA